MLTKEELLNIEEELKANNTKIAIFYIPKVLKDSKEDSDYYAVNDIHELISRYVEESNTFSDFHAPYIVIQKLNYHGYGKLSGISIIVDDFEGPSSHNNSLEISLTHEQGWMYRYPYGGDWEFADDDDSAITNILTILENAVNNDEEYHIETIKR